MPRTCSSVAAAQAGDGAIGSLIQKSTSIPYERINLTAPSCRVDLGQET